MEQKFLFTEHMAVGYGRKPLIREITLQVEKGEIVTLIGPNGAGKSTILKSIIRQLPLISGAIYIGKQSVDKLTDKEMAKKQSAVMTERLQPELMTCEEIISMGRYPYTGGLGILSREDKKKVKEAMELVNVTELAARDFLEISDGQRQKILLARAICQEPELIVLDEPTSFLDIRHKLELLSILKEMVKEKQLAVIMSLHELDLAQKISDQVVCVCGDTIAKYGTPEEIFCSSYINELYGVHKGTYNAEFGCVELPKVEGRPEVFVIGGNGSGISLYRKLQRQGIPFATGVLHANDVDCILAKELSDHVYTEKAFEPISEEKYRQALQCMEQCKTVYCTLKEFGSLNKKNQSLLEIAKNQGKLL